MGWGTHANTATGAFGGAPYEATKRDDRDSDSDSDGDDADKDGEKRRRRREGEEEGGGARRCGFKTRSQHTGGLGKKKRRRMKEGRRKEEEEKEMERGAADSKRGTNTQEDWELLRRKDPARESSHCA